MNGEEEAAFVDSFFLPGGILDPEEEEDEAPSPNVPENPWANEARPLVQEEMRPPGLAVDGMVAPPPGIHANNGGLGNSSGHASHDPTSHVSAGPLHHNNSNGFMRDTLYDNITASANSPTKQPTSNNNGSSALPFRPPPGFTHPSQQPPGRIIPEEALPRHDPLIPNDDNEDDDDSIRSVPHELYDKESLSASSLSGSSSVDESTITTPNTSSILDDTPNTSAHVSMELPQESRDELGVLEEKPHLTTRGNREDVAEKSLSKLAKRRETSSPRPKQGESKQQASQPTAPVNKSRNRRGGKSKRNKNSTNNNNQVTRKKTSATPVCVERKKQTPYIDHVRASLDWTTGLLQHFLSILRSAIQTTFAILTSTATFWKSLLKLSRQGVFILIRFVGILISFSILVGQNAIAEAAQEWRVLSYFATLYLCPHIMSLFMELMVLPHWTPHVVACCTMYLLCRPPYLKQLLYYTDKDTAGELRNLRVPRSNTSAQSHNDEQSGASNMALTLCRVILRQIRFNLPVVFLLEGFSLKIGTAMALDGPGRIVTAYVILILRLGLLFSPMAWLCGAIQVLVALYLYWVPFIDVFILMFSLASVRFTKFLEQCNQAAKDIRAKEEEEK